MPDIASPAFPSSSDPPPSVVLFHICRLPETNELITLTIPTKIANFLTSKPRKWLHYVAWTILGLAGFISCNESEQGRVDEDSLDPVEPGQFFYLLNEEFNMTRVVQQYSVDKSRSRTQNSQSRISTFASGVAYRDGNIGAGIFLEYCDACHIFPCEKQQSTLDRIFERRSTLYNPQPSHISYDDICNGILLDPVTHRSFDNHEVTLIRVPNSILKNEDVPFHRSPVVLYPDGRSYRYALHFFTIFDEKLSKHYDHPSLDIPLPNATDDTAPSPLLVDYRYGVAAMNRFGKKDDIAALLYCSGVPEEQPSLPSLRPPFKLRTEADRQVTAGKLNPQVQEHEIESDPYPTPEDSMAVQHPGASGDLDWQSTGSLGSSPTSEEESDGDEDLDPVYYFMDWLSSYTPAAHAYARRQEEEAERKRSAIREWVEGSRVNIA